MAAPDTHPHRPDGPGGGPGRRLSEADRRQLDEHPVSLRRVAALFGPHRARLGIVTVLIIAYAIQSVLIGLRWGYGILAVLPAMAIMASAIAPLAWLSFRSLCSDRFHPRPRTIALHLTPAVAVAGLVVFWPAPVGLVIVALFVAYGVALLWDA